MPPKQSRSPRKNAPGYSGASGTITAKALAALSPTGGRVLQRKWDGCWAAIGTSPAGIIQRVWSRVGKDLPGCESLIGLFAGQGSSVLHGELMILTEAARAHTESLGYVSCVLFDCAMSDGRDLSMLPYSERRAELFKVRAAIETFSGSTQYRSSAGTHDSGSGRFATRQPTLGDVLPVIEQHLPGSPGAKLLIEQVHAKQVEGAVVVSTAAPLSRRSSKAKFKIADTLDAVVLSADTRTVLCMHLSKIFTASRGSRNVAPGDIVSVKYNGWYQAGTAPRFPRIHSVRHDLAGAL